MNAQGYSNAIKALEADSNVQYDCGSFDKPHRLRSILNEHHDLTQCLLGPDPSSLDEMSFEQELVSSNNFLSFIFIFHSYFLVFRKLLLINKLQVFLCVVLKKHILEV